MTHLFESTGRRDVGGEGVLRLALPKARLLDRSRALLAALGVAGDPRVYRYQRADQRIHVWLVRMRDVPMLLENGDVDLGVAPDEWIENGSGTLVRLERLGWYNARLALLAEAGARVARDPVEKWGPIRVATEYPRVASRFLRTRGVAHEILGVHGSAEAFVPSIADVVVDVIETGRTMARHGLTEIAPVLDCDVHLLARPDLPEDPALAALVDTVRRAARRTAKTALEIA